MVAKNVLRQIELIIYRLKREFGVSIVIRRLQSDGYDLETGVHTPVYADYTVRRAVVLPNRGVREFSYDLSFIAANKNFTYGGFFDSSTKQILVDAKDLPKNFIPTENDICVYEERPYIIKEIVRAEVGYAYMITCKEVSSSDGVS